jgi:hypothetical protein
VNEVAPASGSRTRNLRFFRPALSQLSYSPTDVAATTFSPSFLGNLLDRPALHHLVHRLIENLKVGVFESFAESGVFLARFLGDGLGLVYLPGHPGILASQL